MMGNGGTAIRLGKSRLATFAVCSALWMCATAPAPALAQVRMGMQGSDWERIPPSERVVAISHCREKSRYRLTFQDGSSLPWHEYDLRLKLDSTPGGPPPGIALLLPAGGQGDRAYLVFRDAEDLKRMLQSKC